jgi:ubiquinone/menaquinone biosynthesis C-methylase UbiE
MDALFDKYDKSFGAVVQSSIDFSGLPHSFFTAAKADALRELITTRLHGTRNLHMLDVGCGIGEFHPFVRGMFGRICGADVSAASIAQARIRNPEVQYEAYLGETLPYDDAALDLSIAICVLHHVPPPQWVGFLREMRRVVRSGGLVCLIEHNPLNPLTRLAVARWNLTGIGITSRWSEPCADGGRRTP